MATIRRLLFIVGSRRIDFYESLRRTFRGDDTVQVVLDRRRSERRKNRRAGGRTVAREQRVSERRERQEIDRQLRARGYAVVGIPAPRALPRHARETARS
jgi:hypothetical protein